MVGKHEYKPLMGEEANEDDSRSLEASRSTNTATNDRRLWRLNLALTIVTILSLSLNIVQATLYRPLISLTTHEESRAYTTRYAELKQDAVELFWNQSGPYTNPDDNIRDHLWDDIDVDSGVVAVSKSWAKERGLVEGATFPWDTDKALYFVNAYHSLHCIKQVYRAFRDYQLSRPPTIPGPHVIHCLDQLLADTRCQADDTLRASNVSTPHVTASYQFRQCRSWDALEKWTLAHPGCYRYGNFTFEDNQQSQMARMRYCPEGTPELEKVRKYFGKGKDWKPAEEKKWSWFD